MNSLTKFNNLKRLTSAERDNIVNSFKNRTLKDSLSDRVLHIDFDHEGNPEYLYFTLGGPLVYLTLASNKGIIFGEHGGQIERSAISWSIWGDIEKIILDFIDLYKEVSND